MTVSTLYGNIIGVIVYPVMSEQDFKAKIFEDDLWDGKLPTGDGSPLRINVDMAAMMAEGKHWEDPGQWQTGGRYNRFRLCLLSGDVLNDDGVLQPDILTDNSLFKVQ